MNRKVSELNVDHSEHDGGGAPRAPAENGLGGVSEKDGDAPGLMTPCPCAWRARTKHPLARPYTITDKSSAPIRAL